MTKEVALQKAAAGHGCKGAWTCGTQSFHPIAAPHRLGRPRNLKTLPSKNGLQPIQRKVLDERAGYDVGQQSRPGHASSMGDSARGGHGHLRRFPGTLALHAGIFLNHPLTFIYTS
jgi:hypothetical protein